MLTSLPAGGRVCRIDAYKIATFANPIGYRETWCTRKLSWRQVRKKRPVSVLDGTVYQRMLWLGPEKCFVDFSPSRPVIRLLHSKSTDKISLMAHTEVILRTSQGKM